MRTDPLELAKKWLQYPFISLAVAHEHHKKVHLVVTHCQPHLHVHAYTVDYDIVLSAHAHEWPSSVGKGRQ